MPSLRRNWRYHSQAVAEMALEVKIKEYCSSSNSSRFCSCLFRQPASNSAAVMTEIASSPSGKRASHALALCCPRRKSTRMVVSIRYAVSAILPQLDFAAQCFCKSDRVLGFGIIRPHAKSGMFARTFAAYRLLHLGLQKLDELRNFHQTIGRQLLQLANNRFFCDLLKYHISLQ